MDENQLTTATDELLSKQALHELLMRYCRGVDRCDPDLLASVFHPDAYDDHGLYKGDPPGFIEWLLERQQHYVSSMHCVLNELFEIDGDVAHGEAYYVAYAVTDDPPQPLEFAVSGTDPQSTTAAENTTQDRGAELVVVMCGGRYIDRFERRHGTWRIARRQVTFEWGRTFLASEPVSPLFAPPQRDRTDLSYAGLVGFGGS